MASTAWANFSINFAASGCRWRFKSRRSGMPLRGGCDGPAAASRCPAGRWSWWHSAWRAAVRRPGCCRPSASAGPSSGGWPQRSHSWAGACRQRERAEALRGSARQWRVPVGPGPRRSTISFTPTIWPGASLKSPSRSRFAASCSNRRGSCRPLPSWQRGPRPAGRRASASSPCVRCGMAADGSPPRGGRRSWSMARLPNCGLEPGSWCSAGDYGRPRR